MLNPLFLNSDNINVLVRQADSRMNVVAVVGLVIFILYTIVKVFYSGYYNRLVYVLFKQDYSGAAFSESNTSFINAGFYVLLASVLSISATVFVVLSYHSDFLLYFENFNVVLLALIVFAAVIVFFVVKWLIYSFWGWIFASSQHSKNYMGMFFYALRALGILFFPIFLIFPFVGEAVRNVLVYSTMGLFSISLLYTFYTFWKYSIRIKFFNHYAILYFCTFEILPILIILKLFER